MAQTRPGNSQSIPTVGLRNTARFQWRGKEEMMERGLFVKGVLMGQLKVKVDEVFCLQLNLAEKAFDVTVKTEARYGDLMGLCVRVAAVAPLSSFRVVGLDRPNFRVITVHTYNPYVTDLALASFLGKYGEVTSAARYVCDPWGIWTGRRQYQVLLRQEKGGHDGLKHPPGFFNLGGDRGYLYYSRQPAFCRRCRESGHSEAGCRGAICRFCGLAGHEAKDCVAPKKCHGCGLQGHLYKSCPSRKKTFAEAAGGGATAAPEGRRGEASTSAGDPGAKLRPVEEVVQDILDHMEEAEGASRGDARAEAGTAACAVVQQEAGAMEGGSSLQALAVAEGVPETVPSVPSAGLPVGGMAAKRLRGPQVHGPLDGGEGAEEGGGKKVKGPDAGGLGGNQGGEGGGMADPGGSEKEVQKGLQGGECGGAGLLELVDGGVGEGLRSPFSSEGSFESAGMGLEMDLAPALVSLSSPLGVDAYEGPVRPSTAPNVMPFSWADEAEGLFGD